MRSFRGNLFEKMLLPHLQFVREMNVEDNKIWVHTKKIFDKRKCRIYF